MPTYTAPAPDRRDHSPSRLPTAPFVRVPMPLLNADARDRAIYALIARLYALTRRPIPLSTADLGTYDPSLSYGAASRCLGRLVRTGWLLPQTRRGQKSCYTPTWGPERPIVGTAKPRRLATVPLPASVLDSFLGKLTPRMDAPATVARYTSVPLLTLADVGIYVQALTGVAATTERLERYGLTCNGVVGPLPTVADTLARVTQQTLAGGSPVHLTQAGARVLGLPRPVPPPPRATTDTQPLFFIERHLIGGLIDHLIAAGSPCQGSGSPARSDQRACAVSPTMIPWNAWSHESTNHESSPQPESHGLGVSDPPYVMSSMGADSSPRADLIHQQLNPDRTILPGEWLELAALDDQHGGDLLIWQARAQRAGRTRVTPDYYRACAAQDALAHYRPPQATRRSQRIDGVVPKVPPVVPTVTDPAPTPVGVPDQERVMPPSPMPPSRRDGARRTLIDQLGQAAGEPVRCPRLLDQVTPDLLRAWTRVVGHAGLQARLADPLGFAIRQLQQGHPPPPPARLDTWANQAAPAATPWTMDDVARLNQAYGDLFRLGSGKTVVTTDCARPQTGRTPGEVRVGPWTAAEVARLNQEYGDLFRLGSGRNGPQTAGDMCTDRRPRGKISASAGTPGEEVLPPRQGTRPVTDSALAARLVAELRLRAGRGSLRRLLDQITLTIQNGTVQVQCRDGTQVTPVHTSLMPMLPTVLAELGVAMRVVVRVQQ